MRSTASTGDSLAQVQEEAASKEQVLKALGRAATELRGNLGESLASVQKFDKFLQEATTSSLEALKAFTQADELREKGEPLRRCVLQARHRTGPQFCHGLCQLGTTSIRLRTRPTWPARIFRRRSS